MRLSLTASVVGLLAFGAMIVSPDPVMASKSKMGCDTETEMWDAALGKCQPGTPKYKRKSADQASQPAAKVTAAAKKAPAAAKKAPAAKKAAPAAAK
jgi:hypothetical protein